MSIILLALYVIGTGIYAAPTSLHLYPESANGIIARAECVCPDAAAARSVLDIIWGCLATTFLCTWVTVHPHIPAPGADWWWIAWRRAKAMYWSVVAPESTIIWAIRQWRGARYLANKYKSHGWTITHGYFFQMGGFLLYEDGKPSITLMEDHFDPLLKDSLIEFPFITEEDINDRSKGDALSKGLALFQTLWFVIQCIARGAQHLALTEIELSTIALAVLNAVTYFFWWNKPLDVQHPVAVFLILKKMDDAPMLKDEPNAEIPVNEWSSECTSNHIPSMLLSDMLNSREDTLANLDSRRNAIEEIEVSQILTRQPLERNFSGKTITASRSSSPMREKRPNELPKLLAPSSRTSPFSFIRDTLHSIIDPFVSIFHTVRSTIRTSIDEEGKSLTIANIIFIWPCSAMTDLIGVKAEDVKGMGDIHTRPPQRVPIFYAVDNEKCIHKGNA